MRQGNRARLTSKLLVPAILATLATACASGQEMSADGTESEEGIATVRVGLPSTSRGAGVAAHTSLPQALGYWQGEGIKVEFVALKGSAKAAQAMEAGRVDFAIAAPSFVISAVSQGADLVAYFNEITRNFFIPHVLQGSDITSAKDLQGKRIGVQSLESTAVPFTQGLMKEEGVNPSSAQFIKVPTGPQALTMLQRGRVDALAFWDQIYAKLEGGSNLDLRPVAPQWFEQLGFQQVIFTTRAKLKEEPGKAVALARGIAKALAFADKYPRRAVKLHWGVYPESKAAGVTSEQALDRGVRVLEARTQHTQPVDGTWGKAKPKNIKTLMQFLREIGIISEAPPVDKIWTGRYLDEINGFEAAKLQATNGPRKAK